MGVPQGDLLERTVGCMIPVPTWVNVAIDAWTVGSTAYILISIRSVPGLAPLRLSFFGGFAALDRLSLRTST